MKIAIFITFFFISINFVLSQNFWTEVNSGVTTPLTSVSNVDGINAWTCGNSGVVLKTTNTGYNWQSVGSNGIPNTVTLNNIFAFNSQFVLTAGYSGSNTYVFRTSNAGTNWTQVFTQLNGIIYSIWMTSVNNGFMVGKPVGSRWSLWKTTNGGINWDSAGLFLSASGTDAGWNNSFWINGNNIWFGTNASKIYLTSNNGINWAAIAVPFLPNSYGITFNLSTTLGFASGEKLIKSTNAGLNWVLDSVLGNGIINTVAVDPYNLNVWFARNDNNIYHSYNGGTSWFQEYTTPSGNFNHMSLLRMLATSSGYIYAVRSNGGISRCSGIIEGVKIISNEIPRNFKLYQNYPNPFNPSTKIKIDAPLFRGDNKNEIRGYFIRLVIYNCLGKEIEKRAAEIIQPGTYEDSWNGSAYPSGVYYYRLTYEDPSSVSGGNILFSITKKMILLK